MNNQPVLREIHVFQLPSSTDISVGSTRQAITKPQRSAMAMRVETHCVGVGGRGKGNSSSSRRARGRPSRESSNDAEITRRFGGIDEDFPAYVGVRNTRGEARAIERGERGRAKRIDGRSSRAAAERARAIAGGRTLTRSTRCPATSSLAHFSGRTKRITSFSSEKSTSGCSSQRRISSRPIIVLESASYHRSVRVSRRKGCR